MQHPSIIMRKGSIIKRHETEDEVDVDWKIEDFLPLLQNTWAMRSPYFIWHSVRWVIQMIHNADNEIQLFLWKTSCPSVRPSVVLKFGIRLTDRITETRCVLTRHFKSYSTAFGTFQFILKSELIERKSEFIVEGVLTLSCSIATIETLKISQKRKYEDLEALSSNMKSLYNSQNNSDMSIVIGERKYPVHRAILAARSDVFSAMLQHTMKEENTGIIEIEDCDPEVFISYLYTGKAEKMSCRNVCKLYRAADKYNVQGLKVLCMKYIETKAPTKCLLSFVIEACETKDTQLLSFLQQKFNENALEIMKGNAWKEFLEQNSTIANQLMINMLEK